MSALSGAGGITSLDVSGGIDSWLAETVLTDALRRQNRVRLLVPVNSIQKFWPEENFHFV